MHTNPTLQKILTILKKIPFLAMLSYLIANAFLVFEMGMQTSLNVMNHQLIQTLGINMQTLGFISAAYFITYTFMQIPAGLLFDRFSSKWVIANATLICCFGIMLFASTNRIPLLMIARLLMGLGSACAFIGVLVVASQWFDQKIFSFLVGIAQLLAAMGAAMGEAPLAHMIANTPWQMVLFDIAGSGFLIALAAAWIIPKNKQKENKKPSQSALQEIWHTLKAICRKKQNLWIALYACCNWAPILILAEFSGVSFLEARGFNFNDASALIFYLWLGIMVTSPSIGFIIARYPIRLKLVQYCALIGCICSLFLMYAPNISYVSIAAAMFGIGIASSGQILTFGLIKDQNPNNITGTIIAFNNMAVVAGGLIFQPLVGMTLNHLEPLQHSAETMHAVHSLATYRWALILVPLAYGICYLASLFKIQDTPGKPV
jgi:MFS family permease